MIRLDKLKMMYGNRVEEMGDGVYLLNTGISNYIITENISVDIGEHRYIEIERHIARTKEDTAYEPQLLVNLNTGNVIQTEENHSVIGKDIIAILGMANRQMEYSKEIILIDINTFEEIYRIKTGIVIYNLQRVQLIGDEIEIEGKLDDDRIYRPFRLVYNTITNRHKAYKFQNFSFIEINENI